jgi:hypothetical protein
MSNFKIPTSVELTYNNKLKNKILIEIPHTNYHLLGTMKDKKLWDISILNQIGCCKRNIITNLSDKEFTELIVVMLAHPEQTNYKKQPKIKDIKEQIKSIIKTIETKKNHRFNKKHL